MTALDEVSAFNRTWAAAHRGRGVRRITLDPRSSLTLRVSLAFILFALLLLASVAALVYDRGRAALQRVTIVGLSAEAIGREAALHNWIGEQVANIATLARSPLVVQELQVLLTAPPGSSDAVAARDRFRLFADAWGMVGHRFSSVFLMDAVSGRIIAATDPGDIGKYREDRPYFTQGKSDLYVENPFYSVPLRAPTIVFSAPVTSADHGVIGVVAARGDMAALRAIVERRDRARNSDDNYIVNSAGLFVTQPRFIVNPAPLRFGPQSSFVRTCLEGRSGVALADDYRAVPVIAIYRWIPDLEFCLVAKVDQADAFAPVQAFQRSILLIGAIALVCALTIAFALARTITRPVKILQEGAVRLGSGEREVRLPENSRDELGVLARTFNTMAASLGRTEQELRRHATRLGTLNAELAHENAERRRAETEVRTLNEELEQRVASRTSELAAVNHELEAFAYSVSHDLRSPLRAMAGYSQALIEDYGDKLDAEGHDLLERIRANSGRMGQLIDDLLKLSRITRSTLDRQPVDLSALAWEIAETLHSGAHGRRVAFDIAPGLAVEADPQLVRVALENLLGNAWKFTGKTADAEIVLGATVENGRAVYFVRDNGVGFNMQYVDRLFAPFQRLHRQEEFEGTGIGLATVARVVHRHGGKVWASSAIGQGTTIFFTF